MYKSENLKRSTIKDIFIYSKSYFIKLGINFFITIVGILLSNNWHVSLLYFENFRKNLFKYSFMAVILKTKRTDKLLTRRVSKTLMLTLYSFQLHKKIDLKQLCRIPYILTVANPGLFSQYKHFGFILI